MPPSDHAAAAISVGSIRPQPSHTASTDWRPMDRDELLQLLEALLEAERAGVKATILCRDQIADPVMDSVLFAIGRDEGRFCAMLTRHIERLGGRNSGRTGSFYDRLRALAGWAERLDFLNRGQDWVVRKLDAALPAVRDSRLHADLVEMRDVHARNVARCKALIAQVRST